ncbi:hypothetical protein TPA0910_83860 [Streptomyces hygroscopicus subsp. sporocinereus]|uniref:Integral membrane protein n=1 Tax=Streptomyces hygroscopicus TaxID=1912 RepID=A0ABQ3UFM5_STRHY|nr:hypothetical protein [Streptomyces hygroscopicus]GHJ33953.1 hypothetical protein TPA0910_83860 [Streptomyces hygroscopicus]
MTPSRRLTAVLSALLGTVLLLAAPTSAIAAQQPTARGQMVNTTADTALSHTSHAHKHTSATHRHATAQPVRSVSVSKEKPKKESKKKRGFFKKLGIFLIVLLIVFIVIVALVIWLIVHFVRKAFRRRR